MPTLNIIVPLLLLLSSTENNPLQLIWKPLVHLQFSAQNSLRQVSTSLQTKEKVCYAGFELPLPPPVPPY